MVAINCHHKPKHIAYDIHGLDEHCSNGMVDTMRMLFLLACKLLGVCHESTHGDITASPSAALEVMVLISQGPP